MTAARVATGVLGWSPDAFWGATPAELRLALEGRVGAVDDRGLTATIARMMEEFPDG
jgi:uncharacterized phage protein (TIGR02216 family)